MTSRTKIIASIAVVGTVAAVAALVGMNTNSTASALGQHRVLEQKVNAEDTKLFQNFVEKHNRNYLTKEEYGARL